MVSTQREIYSWEPSRRLKADKDVIKRTCRAFDINPSETVRCPVDHCNSYFQRLSDKNIKSLFECLAARRNKKTARKITTLIRRWKDGVGKNQADAFEYESIAKLALGSDAPVRYKDGRNYSVTSEEKEAYRDLYRVSQAFISHNYEENATIYRGVRDISVAKLFAQALDKPDASRYVIETSVISNFTATKRVSHKYSTGIVIEPPINRHNVAMMVDHIFPTSISEDEIHMAGGKLSLPPEKVIHLGNHTNAERKVQTVSKSLESPGEMPQEYLEDIYTILEIMGENNIGVRTKNGREKLDNWFISCNEFMDDEELEDLRPLVEYIKKVDKNKSWAD